MIWVREKIIFRYEFGMWLVLVVGEVGKKSAPFCGGYRVAIDLMGSYTTRGKIASFLLGLLRLLLSSWSRTAGAVLHSWVGTLGNEFFITRGGAAFD